MSNFGVIRDATTGLTASVVANSLLTISQDYLQAIAEGDITGHSSLLKFGTRSTTAANTMSLVWEGTNAMYTYLTAAEQLKVSSSSAQDGVGGTGILTLAVYGLDGSYNEINETVTMNGTTPVTTSNSFLRVFRAYGITAGSSLTNVGNIDITNNAGGNQLLRINAGDSQTLMAMWTVPAGKSAYILNYTFSSDSNKGARTSMFIRGNATNSPWLIKYRAFIFSGYNLFKFDIPYKVTEKTDIEIRCLTPSGAGNTASGATFELWYE